MNIYKVTLTATFSGEVWVRAEDLQEAADLAFEAFGPVLDTTVIPKSYLAENGGNVTDYDVDIYPIATALEDVKFEAEVEGDEDEDDSNKDEDNDSE